MFFRSHCIFKIDRISIINTQKLRLNLIFPFSVSGNIGLQGHMDSSSALDHAKLESNVHSIKCWVKWRFSYYSDRTLIWNNTMMWVTGIFTHVCVLQHSCLGWMNEPVCPPTGGLWQLLDHYSSFLLQNWLFVVVVVARNNLFIISCLSSCGVQLIWLLYLASVAKQ